MAVSSHHVVLFPYMAKGHTIPLLQFARLLLRHRRKQSTISVITVTVFTTPKNQPFVSDFLSDTPEINVFSLPFPENISGIPSGVENTEKLPSMSLFVPFTRATKLLQPFFEESLKNLPEVSFMVSDGFLWWTSESAAKFKIPRLVFYGMNSYASAVSISAFKHKLFTESPDTESDTEPITVPDFPWIRVKKCELNLDNQSGPAAELFMDQIMSITTSHGFLVNSFYELEKTFVDYNNSETPKSWCIGPLCLTDSPKPEGAKPDWIHWLDKKGEEGRPVLYVAFGTQAEISNKQLKELALGLEDSKVRKFLWVTRKDVEEIIGEGFKDRIRETGMIVRDWVDQWEILSHESVKGFLSHCGWNSALESICVGVPLLAWPMMAEQPLNAKMVVEEIKVGVRVETQCGVVQELVTREELSRKVQELMEGETGKTAGKNVKEYSKMAKAALIQETGSSWKNLDLLFEKLCKSGETKEANN